ncbi:MAG: hypothetical protein P1P63_04655 [Treponemataceae bacterium]
MCKETLIKDLAPFNSVSLNLAPSCFVMEVKENAKFYFGWDLTI